MPFYANQSPSVLDPRLFTAAQAGLARSYADDQWLKRGQLDLGYQQAANQRYATDAESQYRQSALTSQEGLARMEDAFRRAQLGQQLTLAERDDAFRYGQLAQQGTQFGQTLGLQQQQQDWTKQYQGGQLTLAQQQAGQDEAFRQAQLYGQSGGPSYSGTGVPPVAGASASGAPMLTLAARQQLADQQFRQQQLAQQGQTAGMEDAYRYAALSQQGGIANAQLSAQQQQAAMEDAYRRAALQQQGQLAGNQLGLSYDQLAQQGQLEGGRLGLGYAQLGEQSAQSQQQNMLARAQQILDAQKVQGQLELGTNQLNAQTWYQGQTLGQNRYTTDQEAALRSRGYDVQEGLGYAGINAQQQTAANANQLGYAQLDSADARAADTNAYNYANLDQRMQEFLTNLGMEQQTFNQNAYQFEQTNALAQQSADDRAEYYDMLGQAKTQPPNPFNPGAYGASAPPGYRWTGTVSAQGLPNYEPVPDTNNVNVDNRRQSAQAYINVVQRQYYPTDMWGKMYPQPIPDDVKQNLKTAMDILAGGAGISYAPLNPSYRPTPLPLQMNAAQPGNPMQSIFNQGAQYDNYFSGTSGTNRYTDLRITQ